MIEIRKLVFDYNDHRALHNITFSIPSGSVTALVGENGSGKTTLMRCIVGLALPLSGDIYVNKVNVIESAHEAHKYIGYLSDSFGLDPNLTVEQCLRYSALLYRIARHNIDEAVEEVLHAIGLTEKRADKAKLLSRGQKQRVAIGQAIIHKPKFLVMDEPGSGLDPIQRENFAAIITHLNRQGMTILISSHILAELDQYSTHILSLHKGRVADFRSVNDNETLRHYKIVLLNRQQESKIDSVVDEFRKKTTHIINHYEDKGSIVMETNMNDEEIAGFLKYMIDLSIPVVEFSHIKHNLRDLYQHSLSKGGI